MINITDRLSNELKASHVRIKLPLRLEVNKKVENKIELNPMELFVYDNEIAGTKKTVDSYREKLIDMLEYAKYST